MPSIRILTACRNRARALGKAILKLFFLRLFPAVDYSIFKGDFYLVFLLKIFRGKIFKEYESTVSIGQGVEKLHRNAVVVYYDTQCAFRHLLIAHIDKGIAVFFAYFGSVLYLLEIVPEQTAAKASRNGWKSAYGNLESRLQDLSVNVLEKRYGLPVNVAPIPSSRGGIYLGGIVKTHPAQVFLFFFHIKLSFPCP